MAQPVKIADNGHWLLLSKGQLPVMASENEHRDCCVGNSIVIPSGCLNYGPGLTRHGTTNAKWFIVYGKDSSILTHATRSLGYSA